MVKKSNKFRDQKKTGRKKTRRKKTISPETRSRRNEQIRKIIGFSLIFLSVYLLFAFISYFSTWKFDLDKNLESIWDILFSQSEVKNWTGRLGAFLSYLFISRGFGAASFLLLLIIFNFGFKLALNIKMLPQWKTLKYSLVLMVWLSLTLAFIFKDSPVAILGGVFGYEGVIWLEGLLGKIGTGFLLFLFLLSILIISFNFPSYFKKWKDASNIVEDDDQEKPGPKEDKYNTTEFSVEEEDGIEKTEDQPDEADANGEKAEIPEADKAEADQDDGVEFTIEKVKTEDTSEVEEIDHKTTDTEYDPTLDLPHYQYPPLSLLEYYDDGEINVDKKELEDNKKRIVETLNHYSIKIEKIRATIGPAVTLYEIIPAPGIRISKIKNLEDDIALSLSALGIRIIAPIPGRGTIGIEVPNKNPEIVSLRSIFSSESFISNKAELPLGLGKTISNEPFIVDLTKMPHILMAGATGQGKSVGLNAIITSLLYKKHPAQVKFVMVDPKKVELTLFSKIERHFLARLPDSEEAIITDTRQVVRTLNSLNIEMDNRYDLLKDAQVRNIKEYNRKFIARKLNPHEGHRFLPYLILVIDEFADLIMTAGKEIENPLTRLAQLARAIGIHLIIATQRPSVNIITGTIKANFPARVAYRVISKIDSRTILDFSGADQLIGRGDMLLSTGSDLIRLQCAFVDTEEVEKVTDFIGSQRAYPDAYNLPEYEDEESESTGEYDPNERDELFEEAARLIVQTQQGSTSLLQRKLKLGYNRAGRIIDQLEAAGIVGPFEGSKAREVKVVNEFALEQHLKDLDS